jgi:hypothetical protein
MVTTQRYLNLYRGRNAGTRRSEGGEEGVALRTNLSTIVRQEAVANDLVVVGQNLGVNVLTEAPNEIRGTLDVGKEKGQGLNSEIVGDTRVGNLVDCSRPDPSINRRFAASSFVAAFDREGDWMSTYRCTYRDAHPCTSVRVGSLKRAIFATKCSS